MDYCQFPYFLQCCNAKQEVGVVGQNGVTAVGTEETLQSDIFCPQWMENITERLCRLRQTLLWCLQIL